MASLSEQSVREALSDVIDPEIGINIVELGLVYRVEVAGDRIEVDMTMTTPACPLGVQLKEAAQAAIHRRLPTAESVVVRLVWEPPWTPERMSAQARRRLGWPGND